MKKVLLNLIFLCTTFVITACEDKNKDTDINPSALPSAVISTVQNALPGINITKAEVETKDDAQKKVYEIEGKLINGNEYDVEIYADGTIIKIELVD